MFSEESNINTILAKITNITVLVIVIFLVIVGIGALVYWRWIKKSRKRRLQEEEYGYAGLNRENARDYVKFDTIADDMIILEDGTYFIGAIICKSMEDFFSAPVATRVARQNGYRSFISTIKSPMAYRQHCTQVDLGHTKELYEKARKRNMEELFVLNEEREEEVKLMKRLEETLGADTETSEEYMLVLDAIEKTQKKMDCIKWRIDHLEDQLVYADQLDGTDSTPVRPEVYYFEWRYDPSDFPVDLSKEEIYKRAKEELYSIGKTKISAIRNANVRARRATTEELIEMYYRHYHPVSVMDMPLEKIMEGFDDFIITTTSKDDLEQELKETIAYESMKDMEKAANEVLYGKG